MLFEMFLTLATIACLGLIVFDKLFLRKKAKAKRASLIEYGYSFFPVLCLRTFVMEPFRIPSGSMIPTLLVGDFILVNKFSYGVRLPVLGTKIISIGSPKIGDVVVYRSKSSDQDIIKRVVGVPGSVVEYKDELLYIDHQLVKTEFVAKFYHDLLEIKESKEFLPGGVVHNIYHYPHMAGRMPYKYTSVIVPEGKYFLMGDNRNDSADCRFTGFVPESELLGKALYTWLSIDTSNGLKGLKIRFSRFGKKIV
jgi:signal peptidase I